MKKNKQTQSVIEPKTLIEKAYAVALKTNHQANYAKTKTGKEEVNIYPLNPKFDKITISTFPHQLGGNNKVISGVSIKSGDINTFISIHTDQPEIENAAFKIIESCILNA